MNGNRQDTLTKLMQESHITPPLPKIEPINAAKILFLAVKPDRVLNNLGSLESIGPVDRIIAKFEEALSQKSIDPVVREVYVKIIKIANYEVEPHFSSSTLQDLLKPQDIVTEEEEDILEYSEIFQSNDIQVSKEFSDKFSSIINLRRIPWNKDEYGRKNKTFFVYGENKVFMKICDLLTCEDVLSMYSYMKCEKEDKYRGEINCLSPAVDISFTGKDLESQPGLKDVAFYLLVLRMMKGGLLNRLNNHCLQHVLEEINKGDKKSQNITRAISKLERYPVVSNPGGICIIFTMLENREGASKDKVAVKKLFEEHFQYDVICIDDPTPEDIRRISAQLKHTRFKFYDSLIVFFMGHGSSSHLTVKDPVKSSRNGVQIHRRTELITPFTEISWFQKKPKLFFIQACAVREKRTSLTSSEALGYRVQTDASGFGLVTGGEWQKKYMDYTDTKTSNLYADTLISYATMWYQEAARNERGSLYIDTLVDVFTRFGWDEPIEDLLRRVHYNVNLVSLESDERSQWKQAPYFESALQKKFIFPKLSN